ncbi:hypothetical protein REPUB_Repub15cG0120800 [Reevesia pubescens]
MQRLFFFEFPYPTSHFMQNYLPNLKNSLSLALQIFFPFAGNLRLPPPHQRPYIYYADGDSVPFVVNESTAEFKHLIGNDQNPRRGQELEDLVPKLAPPTDRKAFSHFTKSWASICRTAGDLSFVNNSPPDYSRDLIQDPQGIWSIFLKEAAVDFETLTRTTPTENVRISRAISQSNVEMLKKWIARKCLEENEKQERLGLSTFVVTTAFIWVCLIKLHQSKKASYQLLRNEDRICAFLFPVDCRDRLRLPTNYFGNCLRPSLVTTKRSELIGENGIFVAAKAIRKEIQEFEKEPLRGAESWISTVEEIFGSVSIAESMDDESGVEFGLALASAELDKFYSIFEQGNLRLPPPPQRPYIYYADGDSVPFVVNESTAEFKHLIGNDQNPLRDQELEDLVPKLAPPSMCSDVGDNFCKQQSLMAIQVTIFPNVGISIGVTFCHVAADGKAFSHFTKSWASICRSAGDLSFVNNSPPDYSRDLIQDPLGIWSIFYKEAAVDVETSTRMTPTENVRISPAISQSNVEMLKKWIARKCLEENEKQEPPRLSTFVVTTAFIDRLGLPTNYFGNCLGACLVTAKISELNGENGIFVAAKAIRREIQEFEKEPLRGVENSISTMKEIFGECEHHVTLAGSPKLRVYETDFGFGRPTKSEVVHIGSQGSVSIAESRDDESGVEFGLSLASAELDKFYAIFEQGILNL